MSKILTNTEKDRLKDCKLNSKNISLLKENKMEYLLDRIAAKMPMFCPAYVPLDCNWELHEKIGEGAYGDVYKACCGNKSCNYVLKWQKFSGGEINSNTVKKEIESQNKLAELNLAVPITESYICEEGAFIIMPALKTTLADIIKEESPQKVITSINETLNMLEFLHEHDLAHGDPHLENIMSDGTRLYFIDFDSLQNFSKHYPESEDFSRFMSDLEYRIESLPDSSKRDRLFDYYEYIDSRLRERF
jgi:serine/threonine protein kinase